MFLEKFTVTFAPLNLLKEKETGIIARLKCQDNCILAKLEALGIIPGLGVTIEKKIPDFVISIGEHILKIDDNLASAIQVKKVI